MRCEGHACAVLCVDGLRAPNTGADGCEPTRPASFREAMQWSSSSRSKWERRSGQWLDPSTVRGRAATARAYAEDEQNAPAPWPATAAEEAGKGADWYKGWDDERPGKGADRPGKGVGRPGKGAERPGKGAERPSKGAERPGKGAEWHGKGAERNRWSRRDQAQEGQPTTQGHQTGQEPADYVPFEPEFVYRVILPLSPASMGPGRWKRQVEDAQLFGVKATWRATRANPDSDLTAALCVRPPERS